MGVDVLKFVATMYARMARPYATRRPGRGWVRAKSRGGKRGIPLTAKAVGGHLRGKCHIAPVSAADDKVGFFLVDLDAHSGAAVATLDERVEAVKRALAITDVLVVQSSSNGGRHLYYRLEKSELVSEVHTRVYTHLQAAGLDMTPGSVEVYPAPGKALRLPCGVGSAIIDEMGYVEVDLQGNTDAWHAAWERLSWTACTLAQLCPRKRGPKPRKLSKAIIANACTAVGELDAAGFIRKYERVESTHLLRGKDYRDHMASLFRDGITRPGIRFDTVLKVAWMFARVQRMGAAETRKATLDWFASIVRSGRCASATLEKKGADFFMEQVAIDLDSYLEHLEIQDVDRDGIAKFMVSAARAPWLSA